MITVATLWGCLFVFLAAIIYADRRSKVVTAFVAVSILVIGMLTVVAMRTEPMWVDLTAKLLVSVAFLESLIWGFYSARIPSSAGTYEDQNKPRENPVRTRTYRRV